MRPALEHWLNHNRTVAEAIVARIILAARAREASRAAQAEVSRKTATSARLNLPGKLSDCTSSSRDEQRTLHRRRRFGRRLAKQGRDRGARPSCRCAARCSTPKARRWPRCSRTRNWRISSRRSAAGSGKNFELDKLRYGQVIILADADSDGHHIATLLLTFIYRHLPQLIKRRQGLPRAAAALSHRHRQGNVLGADDAHKDAILKQHAGRTAARTPEITRFKGLGEMMPKVLWETTLNPRTRRLLRVDSPMIV